MQKFYFSLSPPSPLTLTCQGKTCGNFHSNLDVDDSRPFLFKLFSVFRRRFAEEKPGQDEMRKLPPKHKKKRGRTQKTKKQGNC